MTPRDDFPSPSNDVPHNDPTNEAIETMPIEETPEEVDEWAQSEGYTPLAGLHAAEGGGVMFMMAKEDEESATYFQTSQGAFFADINAFEASAEDDTEREVEEPTDNAQVDFRNVADEAMKALEDDYAMTLRGINPDKEQVNDDTCLSDDKDQATESMQSESKQPAAVENLDSGEKNDNKQDGDRSEVEETKPSLVIASLPKFEPGPPPAPIDTDAVQRAVASIQLKDSKLSKRFEHWQQTFEQHPIIPSAPLAAFRKKTAKARQATANLSRSATIVHALHRLDILPRKELVLLILGVDHVETSSVDQVRATFGPLVRWLAASSVSPASINFLLIGPNVVQQPDVDLMPSKVSSTLKKAVATCHLGDYHELDVEHADLAVAFNAGIWGYDSWVPTLEKLDTILVVTSYTIEEAQDDSEVLEPKAKPIWGAEINPFGSNMQRDTKSIQNRVYRENAAWQAWQMN